MKYQAAYKAFIKAQDALIEAARQDYPKGSRVRSQIRHGVFVYGTVVGHYASNQDRGCLVVENEITGKKHRAYPMLEGHVELVPEGQS